MSQLITCDESWFYLNYFSDDGYLKDGENIVIPKKMISDQKILVFRVFSSEGLVLLEMMPIGAKFNSDCMCSTILPKLKQNAHSKFDITENSYISIHMDYSRLHNSQKTIEKFACLFSWSEPKWLFLYGFIKNKLKELTHKSPELLFQSILKIIDRIDKNTWKNVFLYWRRRLQLVYESGDYYL